MSEQRPSTFQFFAAFSLLAILLRWGTFFISVINHDESTYLVIADEMLRGEVYLRDVIDTKPIGIFWVYALLIKITGGAIPLLRLATTLVVALTATLLAWASRRAGLPWRVGAVAGTGYVLMAGVFTYYGISPNSELFFNPLTVAAVGLAVAPRAHPASATELPRWQWGLAGLLLGLAVIIKPFAAAESLGVGLFLVWYYRKRPAVMIGSGLLLLLGFALPLLFVYGYYLRLGLTEELLYYTFEVNRNYPVELVWYLRLKYLGDYLLRYSPLVILAGLAVYDQFRLRKGKHRTWLAFLLVYFLLVTIMVLTPGKRFGHYQIQLHPVLALLAGCFMALGGSPGARVRALLATRKFAYGTLVVFTIIGLLHFVRYRKKEDHPREVAAYLETVLQPGETYFSVSGDQVSHHLLNRPVPTPYVHYSILIYAHHLRAFQLDPVAEAERMLADPTFRYLLIRRGDAEADTELTRRLLEEFEAFGKIGDYMDVYRRTSPL